MLCLSIGYETQKIHPTFLLSEIRVDRSAFFSPRILKTRFTSNILKIPESLLKVQKTTQSRRSANQFETTSRMKRFEPVTGILAVRIWFESGPETTTPWDVQVERFELTSTTYVTPAVPE